MPGSPLRLVVIADLKIARVAAAWPEFERLLRDQPGLQVLATDHTGTFSAFADCAADLVLVLGGDGAILRACRQMGTHQLPVVGVNHGRLGFLADLSQDEFREHLARLVRRDYQVVSHLMFRCVHHPANGSASQEWLGLNEVVVSAGGSLRMIDVELAIGGETVTTYSADGVLISTPVGSTAHNLSAGGPILRQDLPAFVITPICPHTLTNRPLVDSADVTYRLTVPRAPEGTMLVVDGQIRVPLAPGDHVEVSRAPVAFQMAKVPGSSYYTTLHRKLGWGGRPNYRTD
ncbi:MAG TPA: NAD(+) kinase [Planctomycetaceae bacterium]|jgi:NAD+ kinase|nr:NAD(+) kinase [Planctomycetaceae bacterium]